MIQNVNIYLIKWKVQC